ncbi:hypothetical protein FACS1894113_5570 [Alphaproteobacteria bacterium]|nr:hypothetical protein FACS1894113_5570 [Alphaproteobacteria bacterium]
MKKNLCLLIVMGGGLCSNCYAQEIIMTNCRKPSATVKFIPIGALVVKNETATCIKGKTPYNKIIM